MKNILKPLAGFSIALLMVLLGLNAAHATVPTGKMVKPTISGTNIIVLGGSTFSTKWSAPAVSSYKVWVQVPTGSTASNAVYRIYPKGNAVANMVCSSTDVTYPCIKVTADQAAAIDGWMQLTLNDDVNTNWAFNKSGYVKIDANTISNSELLGVAQISFVGANPVESLAIGQTYQGGIIFYLNSTKIHGLIVAPTDQSTGIQWYNGNYTVTGATGTAIGTGLANTNAIVKVQGAGSYAAKLCDDLVISGYSDWYLPSKDELNELNALYKQQSVVGFADGYYWSSTEYNGSHAWSQNFYAGNQYYHGKQNAGRVRAIRDF